MARYTVHVSDRGALTGVRSALNAVRAYYKVRELRDQGFQCVTLTTSIPGRRSRTLSLSFAIVPTPKEKTDHGLGNDQ